jgi:hypothetical protein
MGGANPAIKVNEQHNRDPTASFPSVCVVDGDQTSLANPANRVFALPGDTYPEAYVFARVLQALDKVAARLTVSMQLPPEMQERVKEVVQNRATVNRDRHVIFEQIGEDLDFTAGFVVAGAFLAVWAQEYPEDVKAIVDQFVDLVPRRPS